MYNFNTYGDQAVDLLHYLRNVRDHYKDHMARHSYDKVFFNPRSAELKITEVFKLFLVGLYSLMSLKNIGI